LGLSEEVHVMLSAYAVTCVKDISLAFVEGFVASVAWDYGQSALGIGSSKGTEESAMQLHVISSNTTTPIAFMFGSF
jgi:hypothetical protein